MIFALSTSNSSMSACVCVCMRVCMCPGVLYVYARVCVCVCMRVCVSWPLLMLCPACLPREHCTDHDADGSPCQLFLQSYCTIHYICAKAWAYSCVYAHMCLLRAYHLCLCESLKRRVCSWVHAPDTCLWFDNAFICPCVCINLCVDVWTCASVFMI